MAISPKNNRVKIPLSSLNEQREFFLWKFGSIITREEVQTQFELFKKFDTKKCGELDEFQALMLLEDQSATKTVTEFREILSEMDADKNRKISFLEWCCTYFKKSFAELNKFDDETAREAVMGQVREAAQKQQAVEDAIIAAKEEEERKLAAKAAKLEEESKLTGFDGMKAFFARKVEEHGESAQATLTNEQKIKAEAARRKQLRQAKTEMNEALRKAAAERSAEDVRKSIDGRTARAAALEAAEAARLLGEERAARAARKAKFNSQWGAGLPPPPNEKVN